MQSRLRGASDVAAWLSHKSISRSRPHPVLLGICVGCGQKVRQVWFELQWKVGSSRSSSYSLPRSCQINIFALFSPVWVPHPQVHLLPALEDCQELAFTFPRGQFKAEWAITLLSRSSLLDQINLWHCMVRPWLPQRVGEPDFALTRASLWLVEG